MKTAGQCSRRTTAAVTVLLGFLTIPAAAYAKCNLSTETRKDIPAFNISARDPALAQYSQGLILIDSGCNAEAAAVLALARASLEGEPHRLPARDDLLGLVVAASGLAAALNDLDADRPALAKAKLLSLVQGPTPIAESVVRLRAVLAVVPLLEASGPEWQQILNDIVILADRGFWKARRALMQRNFALGHGQEAINDLERSLLQGHDLQQSLALRILLLDTYSRSQRLLEARLMLASLDPDVGAKLLDPDLRLEFLQIALAVSRAWSAAGEYGAADAIRIYERAVAETRRQ
jgi:hypothetical protein